MSVGQARRAGVNFTKNGKEARIATQGLDDGRALKNGIWDTGLFEKGAEHETTETSSDNEDRRFAV
jgi:hypothetical protein